MAKNVLVIDGADFSGCKVRTITFVEEKPCTAISLSNSSWTDGIEASLTLTANVTPSDTTDNVSWASSNESVATVVNGVVTLVGVGTATITASCGSQTATCSVICDASIVSYNSNIGGLTLVNNIDENAFAQYNNLSSRIYIYGKVVTSGNGIRANKASYSIGICAPITVPNGATKVKITTVQKISTSSYAAIFFFDTTQQGSMGGVPEANSALCISMESINEADWQTTGQEYDIPLGANGFALFFKNSGITSETDPTTFLESKGFSIDLLSE